MKTKVISAIIAIAILIALLIFKGIPMYIAVMLLGVQAFRELMNLKYFKNIPLFFKILGGILVIALTLNSFDGFALAFGMSYRLLALGVIALIVPSVFMDDKYTTKDAISVYGASTFIGLAFNLFILIVNNSTKLFIYLILITILTDTFAMFIGMLIGKHKLIPKVSPNKSIEGSIGGTIVAATIASIFYINLIGQCPWYIIIPITIVLSLIGQLGDLIFSKIKRENDIKDFSNIIPGHGGVLDRLDSIIIVILAYVIFYAIL